MGILDDLKPQTTKSRPVEIALDKGVLHIRWDDGHATRLPLRFVRERCPCAGCVDEWSGKRTLDPTKIPPDIRPLTMTQVGRYALQIGWSDGHTTGIYSWDLFRKLEAEAQQQQSPTPQGNA